MRAHVTCGRGTEVFVKAELCEKLNCLVVDVQDGKVFFTIPKEESTDTHLYQSIFGLKTVERIFSTVTHFPSSEIKGSGKVKFLQSLKDRVLNNRDLHQAFQYTQKLQHISDKSSDKLHNSNTNIKRITSKEKSYAGQQCSAWKCSTILNHADQKNSDLVHGLNGNVQYEERSKVLGGCTLIEMQGSEASMVHAKHYGKGQKDVSCKNNIKTCQKSRTFSAGCDASSHRDGVAGSVLRESCMEEPPSKRRKTYLGHTLQSIEEPSADMCSDNVASETDNCKQRLEWEPNISFRFSVKCGGWYKKWLQPQRLAKELGIRLTISTGWIANLNNPDIEICVHINDDFVTVGIPLTRSPLSKRDYIIDAGLRSTISWIMAHQADIQPGHCILDPMCGKATILIEAAKENFVAAEFIGCDVNDSQIQAADRNVTFAQLGHSVCLIQANALNLPLRSGSVDRIVCDAPFGHKFSVGSCCLHHFYEQLMEEMYRLLVPTGLSVLLVSQDILPVVKRFCHSACNTPEDCKKCLPGTDATMLKPCDRCPSQETSAAMVASPAVLPPLEVKECTSYEQSVKHRNWKASLCSDTDTSLHVKCVCSDVEKFTENNCSSTQFMKPACTKHPANLEVASEYSCAQTSTDRKHGVGTHVKLFSLLSKNYVKLGETHAYILVMQKYDNTV